MLLVADATFLHKQAAAWSWHVLHSLSDTDRQCKTNNMLWLSGMLTVSDKGAGELTRPGDV